MSLERPRERAEECALTLHGVEVGFAGRTILRDIDWEVAWGQSVLVVGPSGCGKSTLALLAAGLIPGTIEADVEGEVWRSPHLARSGAVGYVFQDPDSQFCQIRVGEEVAFGLENRAVDPSLMDGVIMAALARSHLPAPLDIEHLSLSGGMKQKLAVASALAMEPELMILDEPTANLDPASTVQVFDEIERLLASGTTLVVIEHKFEALADRIPWMLLMDPGGRIHRLGRTRQLMEQERTWMMEVGLIDPEPPSRVTWPGMVGAPLVELKDVSAQYRKRGPKALMGVNLEVGPGELLALVGANGAGKSTLLKVAAGLMKPSQGQVVRSSRAAFGFQNPEHQFIFERVVDELANGYVEGEVPDHVRGLLDEFGLGHEAQKSPYALSQGQKRRLSVAVMVSQDHDLYCLDEPTFGQDAKTRAKIMERLQARQQQGAAVIISTHDLDMVRQYASRVVVVDQGTVIFDGSYGALMESPQILERARLLGRPGDDGQILRPQAPTFAVPDERIRASMIGRLNPAWKLFTVFIAVGLTVFAHNLDQAILAAVIPLFVLTFLSGQRVSRLLKRLIPFVLFFATYAWTMTAYAAVGPHTPVVHVLWYRLSYPGFLKGLILGFRMLAAVSFGLLFVSTVDVVDLVKSLSRQFRIPPKFTYGTLAGLRFFPQFQEEWSKLRMARRIRGRDAHWSLGRIATYALPLLSDAVRLSERVAIAMEARGFVGAVTESSGHRTYYKPSRTGWADLVFGATVILAVSLALWH